MNTQPTREEIGAAMRKIKANPPTAQEQKDSFMESVINDVDGLFPLHVDVDFNESRTLVDLANEQREFLDTLRDAGFVDLELPK